MLCFCVSFVKVLVEVEFFRWIWSLVFGNLVMNVFSVLFGIFSFIYCFY